MDTECIEIIAKYVTNNETVLQKFKVYQFLLYAPLSVLQLVLYTKIKSFFGKKEESVDTVEAPKEEKTTDFKLFSKCDDIMFTVYYLFTKILR